MKDPYDGGGLFVVEAYSVVKRLAIIGWRRCSEDFEDDVSAETKISLICSLGEDEELTYYCDCVCFTIAGSAVE